MRSTPSSGPSPDSSRWPKATEASDGLRTLARGLTRARGFALFFAVCNKPVERDQLVAMLGQALPGTPLHRVELTDQSTDILAELDQRCPKAQGPVLILNIEKAVSSDTAEHQILKNLNLQRPQWSQQIQQPVVFWVPQYVLGFIEREAPDFFDWRSDTVTFPELEVDELNHWWQYSWIPVVDDNLPKEARLTRIKELRTRLKENPPTDDPVAKVARAKWLYDLAKQLVFTGEGIDEAVQLYQEALGLYETIGDKRSWAITQDNIARIQADKGELDTALQSHQENLRLLRELGDKQGEVVTQSAIARIQAAKGETDAALQLYEKNLKIFRGLGDKRGEAWMLDEIAQIRAVKGELNAALQTHQEEIAIYEALGDKRAQAVTLGNIAQIRAAKGDVDTALKSHLDRLKVFKALGDKRQEAQTLWSIARIEVQRKQWQKAREHLANSYNITLKLDQLDGICQVGLDLGQTLAKTGQREEGMKVLTRSHEGFLKLGQTEKARKTQAIIDEISRSSS